MNEIKCPHCGKVFQIDESAYAKILKQIKDAEFDKEIKKREEFYRKELEQSIKLAKSETEKELSSLIASKDKEISKLNNALKTKEEETTFKLKEQYLNELNKKDLQLVELENDLKIKKAEYEINLKNACTDKDAEIAKLNNQLQIKDNEFQIKEMNIKENYENKLKNKDEQLAYYKDFKARQSTKMIGESLEQHCNLEFNRLRPLFKNAYFAKDNDAKSGSKGDFIFRDFDDANNEIVSIMFEMKNEADTTSTKHKNEDFFKELDKDRREKNCEYAVLVSLLEIDNDYYNDGIVDVSHLYDKMYVIRPQFFIPLITLIRNLANKSLEYKKELIAIRNQNIDITHFEENMNTFKESFSRNYRLASDRFKKAIDEIDKTIEHLQKTKENLLKTDDNLRIANNKANDLSIKKLTSNSPTVREMFDNLDNKQSA